MDLAARPVESVPMRRISLIVFLLALSAGAAWLVWSRLRPPEVTLVQPTRGPAVDAVYASGLVEPSLEIRIAPRSAGRIVDLLADEGTEVKAGQLLARLEDADLQASVSELQSRLDYAQSQFTRSSELQRRALVSQDAVDRTRTDLDAARAALRRARQQADFMRLVAPAAGRIIRRDGEIGEFVPVNQVIFYMAGPAPLRITADVDEEDVPRVQRGQRVLIRTDAFPDQVFEGQVSEITPRGDPVARSYRVRIALVGTPPLKIGMTAETNIVIEQREDALLLPASAVTERRVWRVRDGRAVSSEVAVGVRGAERVEIRRGLGAGDAVIAVPPEGLAEGARVSLRAEAVAAAPAPQVEPSRTP
jgi:RND family efflux transporter MFP subunit